MNMDTPQTWHHGLVAEWWSLFNVAGPELEFFQRFFPQGSPVLDAGCGTGRLLLPWLEAGFDVDGCDVSPDMLAACRAQAGRRGLTPHLWAQALCDLAPPRRYGAIVVCGVFGLGSTRAQDQEALSRLKAALEPDGTLLLDNEAPYSASMRWGKWPRGERGSFPEPWPEEGARETAADGTEYELRSRALALDVLDQSVVLELRAQKSREGAVIATEEHTLSMRGYFRDELVLMLEHAGFSSVDVRGDHTDEPATADHQTLVFIARA